MTPKNLLVVQFDKYTLSEHPKIKNELAEFYCSIWMHDPNFGEYRQCPVCKTYFDERQVEQENVTSCSGSSEESHATTALVLAWDPEYVKTEILDPDTQLGPKFFGAVAVDTLTQDIIGFSWGKIRLFSDVESSFGQDVSNLVRVNDTQKELAYYSEIATATNRRGQGIGKSLCRMVTNWMKTKYPNLPGLLRTHQKSPARYLFEKAGFTYFADDPMYGDGRILLKVDSCSNLTPENL